MLRNEATVRAVGRHLVRLRTARGWSQQALADSADLSKPTIFRIEKARGSPTLDVLASLAFALEISLAELLTFPA